MCRVKYYRCQLQQSPHCLSVMNSFSTAKCPKVNPSGPGIQKVNDHIMLDDGTALLLTRLLWAFCFNNASLLEYRNLARRH